MGGTGRHTRDAEEITLYFRENPTETLIKKATSNEVALVFAVPFAAVTKSNRAAGIRAMMGSSGVDTAEP